MGRLRGARLVLRGLAWDGCAGLGWWGGVWQEMVLKGSLGWWGSVEAWGYAEKAAVAGYNSGGVVSRGIQWCGCSAAYSWS